MTGLLDPTIREVRLGSAEVRQIFKVPKVGNVQNRFFARLVRHVALFSADAAGIPARR